MIIKMMSAGIISRTQKLDKSKAVSSEVSIAMTTYNVETEGILFLHVKYFVYFLTAAVGFSFIVVLIEIIVYKLLKYYANNSEV